MLTFVGVVVLAVTWLWNTVGVPPGDRWVVQNVWSRTFPTSVGHLQNVFGDLGTPSVALVTVAVISLVVVANLGLRSGVLVVAAAFGVVVNTGLKELHGPTELAEAIRGSGADAGFPSGHAAYAAALFGLLAVLGARHGRRDVVAVAAFLIVAMAPARILSRSHVPSELVAGYAAGFVWLGLVLLADARIARR